MRIRITIEYDPDKPEDMSEGDCLITEQAYWRQGDVSLSDIETISDGIKTFVQWEIIP